MTMYQTVEEKWNAVVQRDRSADGLFFYGVATTGVYCRPGCASRRPNRANVLFFDTIKEAEKAGFRPCKRCHPANAKWRNSQTLAISKACRIIENEDPPPNLEKMAAEIGLSPFHFHRLFKKIVGVTPKQYAMEIRLKRARAGLQNQPTVTDAIYGAGFESSSRFYEKAASALGMRPATYQKGAPGVEIRYGGGQSFLGWVLVATTQIGICFISIGEAFEALEKQLYKRFPKAHFKRPDREFEEILTSVLSMIETPHECSIDLPLDIQGTAFQRRVWIALQGISPGATASYAEVARRIGNPDAARAVAQACAANPAAVVIPCHRVVRQNGETGGYRWGVERKRKLLCREKPDSGRTLTEDSS